MLDEHSMPFLYQYARQHTSFTQHYSGGNISTSGMFSLLYGLQGSYISAHDLNYQSPALTQELKQQGYQLALFAPEMDNVTPAAIFNDLQAYTQDSSDSIATAEK